MAESLDPEERRIEIDERWFMEWVELGLSNIEVRLRGEWEMDEIDRQRGEQHGSQEQGR